ncbi:DNA repair protein RAD51 [Pycnococcus provasolii]
MADDVLALDVSPSTRALLISAGFRSKSDFLNLAPMDLAAEAHIPLSEASAIVASLRPRALAAPQPLLGAQSALQMLEREETRRHVVTFCRTLDDVLGGGVALGEVTEVCGVPGVGKTQLAMQLGASVQVPARLGGVDGDAVYIDTEGSFMAERFEEMCEGVRRHFARMRGRLGPEAAADADALTTEGMLQRLHYFRAYSHVELVAAVTALPGFIAKCARPVRLVVLDSVAFPFRHDFGGDFAQRSRVLTGLAASLQRVADECEVAIVVVNQVTTKGGRPSGGEIAAAAAAAAGDSGNANSAARVIPALGETWAHCSTSRLTLAWDDSLGESVAPERCATLAKSPRLPTRTAWYSVVADGIRGVKSTPAAVMVGDKRSRDDVAAPAEQ